MFFQLSCGAQFKSRPKLRRNAGDKPGQHAYEIFSIEHRPTI